MVGGMRNVVDVDFVVVVQVVHLFVPYRHASLALRCRHCVLRFYDRPDELLALAGVLALDGSRVEVDVGGTDALLHDPLSQGRGDLVNLDDRLFRLVNLYVHDPALLEPHVQLVVVGVVLLSEAHGFVQNLHEGGQVADLHVAGAVVVELAPVLAEQVQLCRTQCVSGLIVLEGLQDYSQEQVEHDEGHEQGEGVEEEQGPACVTAAVELDAAG
mmetsp:Transcript_13306/g.24433  ORF Transcript_13306/g.24433 Transcript_13306/m.24433 type:complete len:214 (-) Transcript_13306:4391-5032(-)